MKPKSILTRVLSLTFFVLVLFQITSCTHVNHQNFQKQKYLRGKLKPVYTENKSEENSIEYSDEAIAAPINPDEADLTLDQLESEEEEITNIESDKTVSSDNALEQGVVDEPTTRKHFLELDRKKNLFPTPKTKITENIQSPADLDIALTWFFILLILGLIALPFAFLIGFWAFIIAGILIVGAGVVILTSDYGSNILEALIFVIILGVLLVVVCIALAIALVWFIIWGIIQLVN
jgi:predicted RND superfamily exporter protein